jgi:protein SCO1/2
MIKLRTEKEESLKRQRKQAVGKMAIGGPFELIDHNGAITKSSDFLGQWLFIYFGFTHCPDICPEEIDKMIRAVDLIEKVQIKEAHIKPLFITVDPDRDDVKTTAKYVKDFSPKLLGLTGNKKQIEEVCRSYRVYLSEGPKDEDNDYIVDHTVIMYLVDPEGNFVDYFGQNKTAEEIATAAAIHMSTFKMSLEKNK